MNTILTDDEIAAIQTQVLADFRRHVQEEGRGTASPASIARAVESAVLAKLAQQTSDNVLVVTTAYEQGVGKGHQARQRGAEIDNPYADGPCREAWGLGYGEGKSQADRKRVPIDWSQAGRLMEAAMSASSAGFTVGTTNWAAHIYRAMLAAAPEAPAQADDLNINPVTLGRTPWAYGEAPANTRNSGDLAPSAVDERDRKDAERYRFIRANGRYVVKVSGESLHCGGHLPFNADKFGPAIDKAIDEARAALAQKVQA